MDKFIEFISNELLIITIVIILLTTILINPVTELLYDLNCNFNSTKIIFEDDLGMIVRYRSGLIC